MSSEKSLLKKNKALEAEEIIFYLDLITDTLKRKTVIKGMKNFIDEKNTYSSISTYGVVIFQGESNPITSYNKRDPEEICDLIKVGWSTREKELSFFENGLFEILSYIFGKSKTEPKNFRVIILSDRPSDRNEDYNNALYDLIVKSKMFSTSVDIIRIGEERYYSDDVKLKVISSETQGGIFYCEPDPKRFLDIIGSLVKNRKEFNIIKTDSGSLVMEKDKPFYEKLAVDLITLDPEDEEACNICDKELCPICEAYSDEVRKCYNCGLKFHSCCASLYSINNHIGDFIHIFKCPQCETLLKLDEDYVKMIYKEEQGEEFVEPETQVSEIEQAPSTGKYDYDSFEEEEIVEDEVHAVEKHDLEEKPSEEEPSVEPLISSEQLEEMSPKAETEEEPKEIGPPPIPPPPTKKVKIGGFFGTEIEVKNKVSGQPSPPSQKPISPELKKPVEEKVSITSLKPPKRKSKIRFCKICGTSVTGTIICPTCGNKVED